MGDKAPSPKRAVEPLSQISAPKSTVANVPTTALTVQKTVQKAQNLLDELKVEEKQGYNLAADSKKVVQEEKPAAKAGKVTYEITDNYDDDDFHYDIEEDLPADDHVQENSARNQIEGSG